MKWDILLVILTIVVVIALVVGFFVLSFFNSKGCDQLVIDTYEMHSGIDIPSVDFINCYYDEQEEIRISIYVLRTDVNQYIFKHGFKPVPPTSEIGFKGIGMLSPDELPQHEELYIAEGAKWGHAWRYLVEKETGRMWAELVFRTSTDIIEE